MKRKLFFLIFALLFALLLPVSAGAENAQPDSFPGSGEAIGYVTDAAGLLTAEERAFLEQTAETIAQRHAFGVYIITVDDFREATGSSEVDDGAVTLYRKYRLGITEEQKGILLLLSMEERDFSIVTYSDYGNYIFDAVVREEIAYAFLDDFAYDDWYSGFVGYLDACDQTLANGPERLDTEIKGKIALIFLIPLAVAGIVIFVLGQKMKSVAEATEADIYAESGLILTQEYDRFTHATEVRRKRESESSSSDGGNVRSSSSGGFGRTSGKF